MDRVSGKDDVKHAWHGLHDDDDDEGKYAKYKYGRSTLAFPWFAC